MMAARIQDAATRGVLAALQREQVEEKEAQAVRETQIDETPETQSEHVDEDGRRKNPFARRRSRRRKETDASESSARSTRGKPAARTDDDHRLDVSI